MRREVDSWVRAVMFWDRLMGTFRPYDSGVRQEDAKATSSQAAADRLPAWADPAAEAREGHVVERPHAD